MKSVSPSSQSVESSSELYSESYSESRSEQALVTSTGLFKISLSQIESLVDTIIRQPDVNSMILLTRCWPHRCAAALRPSRQK